MSREMAELTAVDVEALVRRARTGDHDALGELYDRFRDRVARFATGRLGDAEKAEDVTSETFEAVLRNLRGYRPGTDFEAWLFTIAHRRVADHFRRQSRRRELRLDEAAAAGLPGGGGVLAGGPEEAVLAAERRAEVAVAFRRLRPTSRRCWRCGCWAACRPPRSARSSASRRGRCGSPSTGRCSTCAPRSG
jgi:RNA polymerase sigma factor (sigma-70 family)